MAKHFTSTITDTTLTFTRDTDQIDAEAALDGIYVLRTSVRATDLRHRRACRRLQEPGPRRTRLPQPQGHRPGPAPDLPPPRRPRPRPRSDLHARRLPDLAPAPSLGPADLHRREPPHRRRPRRPRPPLHRRRRQSLPPHHHRRRPAHPQLPRPARPPGHPHPQPRPLRRHRHHTVPMLTKPTPTQRRAFELLDAPIPLTLQ